MCMLDRLRPPVIKVTEFRRYTIGGKLAFQPVHRPKGGRTMIFTVIGGPQHERVTTSHIAPYAFFDPLAFQAVTECRTVGLRTRVPEILAFKGKAFPLLVGKLTVALLAVKFIEEPLPAGDILIDAFTVKIHTIISRRIDNSIKKQPVRLIVRFLHAGKGRTGKHNRW